ncbi:tetratricopeptide repeat protein [Sedimentitalea nanhaiensis]|uniref:tetratricopeptide repeat protein n=1 Tax=Sedimentitalea nanhaiensis TaxID=999627 RepID=UPI00040514C8|nr:tetratricopeptide repeat protein [Sedimentitalea nanhaiensis]
MAAVLVLGVGLTSACDTAEERAENHYQTGLTLLEEGDVSRALVEFRNVFQLNAKHEGARLAYARTQRERGLVQDAYGHYLRLVEQYPDNLEGRRALAEMAVEARNWDEAERHVATALSLAPDDVLVQSIDNTVKYYNAVQDKNGEAQQAAIIKAQALVDQDDTLSSAREIVLDDLLRKEDWYAALDVIDEGLAVDPDNRRYYQMRMAVLQRVGDLDGIETQLRGLMERYPDERANYKQILVRFLMAQQKREETEAFLRADAAREGAQTVDQVQLVSFVEQVYGNEKALAEVEKQIAAGGPELVAFRALRAKLNFELGKRDAAIEEMEILIEGADRTAQIRSFEVDLARMLFRQNNAVGARALIEKVLAEDATQPDAVKLKANWLIDDDETGDAIVMLRAALNETPEDPVLMSLLARAYDREGNHELKTEMLALAVPASGQGVTESTRYASVLVADNKLVAAEGVLIDSLRVNPGDITLLGGLGEIYIKMGDWGRVDGVIDDLRRLDDPQAKVRATTLQAQKLAQQNKGEDLTAMLEGLTNDPVVGRNAEIALLRTKLAEEGPEVAQVYLEELLAETPEDPSLLFMKAGFLAGFGKVDEAEAIFEELLAESPKEPNIWIALYRLKAQSGDTEGAVTVLDKALVELPEDGNLLWAKAGQLERDGDIEGAIGIYETMYAQNSNSMIVANNLASLLSNYRTDEASLDRAYTVSRRLRDSDVAAFQDTFGWITFKRGDRETSLDYLRAAASGLPNDPTVQYHLAVNLAALARNQEALDQFRKVVELTDPDNPPAFADEVAAEIARLEAAAN